MCSFNRFSNFLPVSSMYYLSQSIHISHGQLQLLLLCTFFVKRFFRSLPFVCITPTLNFLATLTRFSNTPFTQGKNNLIELSSTILFCIGLLFTTPFIVFLTTLLGNSFSEIRVTTLFYQYNLTHFSNYFRHHRPFLHVLSRSSLLITLHVMVGLN